VEDVVPRKVYGGPAKLSHPKNWRKDHGNCHAKMMEETEEKKAMEETEVAEGGDERRTLHQRVHMKHMMHPDLRRHEHHKESHEHSKHHDKDDSKKHHEHHSSQDEKPVEVDIVVEEEEEVEEVEYIEEVEIEDVEEVEEMELGVIEVEASKLTESATPSPIHSPVDSSLDMRIIVGYGSVSIGGYRDQFVRFSSLDVYIGEGLLQLDRCSFSKTVNASVLVGAAVASNVIAEKAQLLVHEGNVATNLFCAEDWQLLRVAHSGSVEAIAANANKLGNEFVDRKLIVQVENGAADVEVPGMSNIDIQVNKGYAYMYINKYLWQGKFNIFGEFTRVKNSKASDKDIEVPFITTADFKDMHSGVINYGERATMTTNVKSGSADLYVSNSLEEFNDFESNKNFRFDSRIIIAN